jgi:cytidine deaminase
LVLFEEGTLLLVDSTTWTKLEDIAKNASTKAYCPYSEFPVGAALLDNDGRFASGCNVENASYSMTICAERNAVFHAIAEGMSGIAAMVVYTPTSMPSSPCGACRQVLYEFSPKALVRCICDGPDKIELTVEDLLPFAFGPSNLLE